MYTCVLAGPYGSGKTTLLTQIMRGDINNIRSTIGIMNYDFHPPKAPEKTLRFIDTSGQERFGAFTCGRFIEAQYILLVFDLYDAARFESLMTFWMPKIYENSENPNIFLIGNKSDLPRGISNDTIQRFRDQFKEIEHYYEISAIKGSGIDRIIDDLVTTSNKVQPPEDNIGLKLRSDSDQSTNKGGCC